MIYYSRDIVFYNTLYGNAIQNILIKISTWLTVILAVSRHFVVSQPIRARQYMRCRHTVIAILFSVVLWIFLHIPLTWMWVVQPVHCPSATIYFLKSGEFIENETLNLACTYVWAISGFIIPLLILAYCNIKLLHSLRVSQNMRTPTKLLQRSRSSRTQSESSSGCHSSCHGNSQHSGSHGNPQHLITITLVAIVTMFFILVLPSEILHFYEEIAHPDYSGMFQVAMVTANLCQAINFSMNFALYCLVNQYFRKTIHSWIKTIFCCSHHTTSNSLLLRDVNRSSVLRSSLLTKQTVLRKHSSASCSSVSPIEV